MGASTENIPSPSPAPEDPAPPATATEKAVAAECPAPTSPIEPGNPSSESIAGSQETSPVDALTPEEQMRLFEKELKEKDWGHQPC